MILADSNVWIDHLRRPDPVLDALLADEQVAMHPFVVGEVALGSIGRRAAVLAELNGLLTLRTVAHEAVMDLIGNERLFGRGIGYADVHLLASLRVHPDTLLWTRDRRLRAAAQTLGLAADLA